MLIPKTESGFVGTSTTSKVMGVNKNKTAKLLFMISSSLYTNKPGSIIRELCSNAYDSHVEKGRTDTPFVIIAPTKDNLKLTISDCGIGLTYEKACTTVLEFLSSTKDGDDDEELAQKTIGGYGIGAKAPRAYADNYQIICRKDGIEWIIHVFTNSEGLPEHVLLSEMPTSKPDGVDFVVPIKPQDVADWRTAVVNYISGTNYNVEAYMGQGDVLRPKPPAYTYDYGSFSLDVVAGTDNTIKIVYGGQVYDIPAEMNVSATLSKMTGLVKTGLKLRLRFDDPNALTFGLSREGVEVSEKNTKTILEALDVVRADLGEDIKNRLKESTRLDTTYVGSWTELVETSERMKAEEGNLKKSRLGDILKIDLASRTLKVHGVEVATTLPIQFTPTIHVLFSGEKPLKRDFDEYFIRGVTIIAPASVKTEEEAKTFFESLEELRGLKVQYHYVRSTRTVRSSKGGGGGSRQKGYAICEITGRRIDLSKVAVLISGRDQMWAEKFCRMVLKPAKSVPRWKLANCVPLETLLGDEQWMSTLHTKMAGVNSPELLDTLRAARDRLEKEYDVEWPEEIEDRSSKLQEKVKDACLRAYADRSAHMVLEGKYGKQDIPAAVLESPYGSLLEEAESMVDYKARNADKFRYISLSKILAGHKEGNLEATRLVYMLHLEEY